MMRFSTIPTCFLASLPPVFMSAKKQEELSADCSATTGSRAALYGLEGDWSWIGARTSQLAARNTLESLSTSFDVNWLATLRGRAGLAFDSTLVYVTGGVAFGHVNNRFNLIFTPSSGVASFTENKTKVGWTAGVGVEHMFSQHWTARAEFRYVDLGRSRIACSSATDLSGCVSSGYRGDFSNTLKLGLVGLAYKF
jgi:opacity protein-like surface antigen